MASQEVGQAYITVIPRVEGTGRVLSNAVLPESGKVGEEGGKRLGSGFVSGLKSAGMVAIGNVVSNALIGATQSVKNFATNSIQAGRDFDAGMSQVAATMGITKEELASTEVHTEHFTGTLRDFAKEMGASTAFSATQAAEALNYMALAGYDAETSVEMLPTVLNLAAAGSLELGTAADMVTDASSALGLSIDETTEMVDKMAQTASKSNTSVGQLGEAFLTVGGTAKNLKGGTTELATALGILGDNGIKGAEGGTALRNIILSLSSPTDKAAEALDALGVSVFDSEGNMRSLNEIFGDLGVSLDSLSQEERQQALSAIFNKVDLKSANALLANTTGNFDGMREAIDKATSGMSGFAGALAEAGGSVGDEFLTDLQQGLSDSSISAEQLQQQLMMKYDIDAESAMAAIDAATQAVAENGSRWDELSGYIDNAGGAAEQMAKTQLDNLQGDMTIFQSALEGAQIEFFEAIDPLLRAFVQGGTEALTTLTNVFKDSGVQEAIKDMAAGFADFAANAIPAVMDAGAGLQQFFSDNSEIIGEFNSNVGPALSSLFSSIGDALSKLLPVLIDVGSKVLPPLFEAVGRIVEVLGAVLGPVLELLAPIIELNFNIVKGFIDVITGAAPPTEAFSGALDVAKGIFEAAGGVLQPFTDALSVVGDTFSSVGETIGGFVTTAGENIGGFVEGAKTFFSDLGSNVESVFSTISSNVSSNMEEARLVGSDAANALSSAMQGDWESAAQYTADAYERIRSSISDRIESARGAAVDAADRIGEALGFPGLGDTVDSVFNDIQTFMEDPIGNARDFIASIPEEIVGFFSGLGEQITSAIGSINFPTPHISFEDLQIGPTSIPIPHVEWYDKGGIFTAPQLIGVGEKRPEVVAPLEELPRLMPSAGDDEIADLLQQILAKTGTVYIDGKQAGKILAPTIDTEFSTTARRRAYA